MGQNFVGTLHLSPRRAWPPRRPLRGLRPQPTPPPAPSHPSRPCCCSSLPAGNHVEAMKAAAGPYTLSSASFSSFLHPWLPIFMAGDGMAARAMSRSAWDAPPPRICALLVLRCGLRQVHGSDSTVPPGARAGCCCGPLPPGGRIRRS